MSVGEHLGTKFPVLLGVVTIYVDVPSSARWYIFGGQDRASFTFLYFKDDIFLTIALNGC